MEKVTHYHLLPEMGPPSTICWEYSMADNSCLVEFEHFVDVIQQDRISSPILDDASAVLKVVEAVYESSMYPHCLSVS